MGIIADMADEDRGLIFRQRVQQLALLVLLTEEGDKDGAEAIGPEVVGSEVGFVTTAQLLIRQLAADLGEATGRTIEEVLRHYAGGQD